MSAEHGQGMGELQEVLDRLIAEAQELDDRAEAIVEIDDSVDEDGEGAEIPEGRPIQIAIVGRPNAGKSTLVNKIIGEDRLLTGPEAGITRDAIAVRTEWMGTPFRIFDTAGIRKKARVQEKLEKLSVADGLRAVRFAEVVVVLLDVQIPFESQDLRIADLAEREGRAVVVAVNKWDLETEKPQKLNELREAFERLLPQLRGAPMVMVSARTGKGLDRLHDAINKAYAVWNTRISTARLNRWAGGSDCRSPAARAGRSPDPAALHDAGKDPAADIRDLCIDPGPGTGRLQALPRERAPAGFRHAGHADPSFPAFGRQPLQGPQEVQRDLADQAQETAPQKSLRGSRGRLDRAVSGQAEVTRQTMSPTSSTTSSEALSAPTATPTGRP